MAKRAAPALVAGIFLSSCGLVGPDYSAPRVDVPVRFAGGAQPPLEAAALDPFWVGLGDAMLNGLVAQGLESNLDIEAAMARIQAAEAALGRTGVNAQLAGDATAEARVFETEDEPREERATVGLGAAYIFDLFGGVRRGRERALATLDAARFDAGTVRLAYLSELVGSYVRARYFQQALAVTEQTVQSRRRTVGLVNQMREAGATTDLETAQAQALLQAAQARLPVLRGSFEANVFRIATLLDEPAEPLLAKMRNSGGQPRPQGGMHVGVPADLVRNRPDVRAAERTLAAATAAIGVAEADLYPSVRLSGNVAAGTDDSWSFGPTINFPVFNRGFLQANRNVAVAQAREAEIAWRRNVLSAIEEVQAAWALTTRWSEQVAGLERTTRSYNRVLDLSRQSYQAGESILTEVLDAELAVADTRLDTAAGVRDWTLSWLQLQIAAGKGWAAEGAVSSSVLTPKVAAAN